MPDENLREEIKEMMVENLMLKVSKEEIADDLPLFGPGGLGLDSIDALELVVSLEKKFGVSVPNSEVAKQVLVSVNTIHDHVATRTPAGGQNTSRATAASRVEMIQHSHETRPWAEGLMSLSPPDLSHR
jgi:acyl carrier protein